MAQHIQSTWDGFTMIHRYEDLALIRSVLGDRQPQRTVELGTAEGGFAVFLACTVVEWEGRVLTLDKLTPDPGHADWFARAYDNLTLRQADILDPDPETLATLTEWLQPPGSCLYTDNGNKQRELELYAPLLGPDALVGTHDYGTEVDPAWAEPFMASLGYAPYRHAEFERLASPDSYPVSLTRFWVRP